MNRSPLVTLSVLLGLTVGLRLAPAATPAVPAPQTTEQQWIVQSILEDLARLTLFAGHQAIPAETVPIVKVLEKPADGQGAHFAATVQWPGEAAVEQALDLPVHIWNAEGYAPVAAGFLEKRKLAPEKGVAAPAGGALASLTAFSTEALEKENRRLSGWVTAHPLNAEAHAQAALLLAVFACRETSGAFADTRGALNRATAHLALAQALGKSAAPSDSAAVAALLLTLPTGRQIDTEAALKSLEPRAAKQPELRPWLMAARLRERGNWRLLEKYDKATQLERVEYYRAYEASVGGDAVAKELEQRRPELTADWPRIVLSRDFSVSTGHVFTPMSIALEMREAATIFPEVAAKKPEEGAAKLTTALNQLPHGAVAQRGGKEPTVEIIDRGAWALYLQRHLCHAINQTHYFLLDLWGVPDEAAQMRKVCDTTFGKLWLYPLAVVESKRQSWLEQNTPGAVALISRHPEWVEPRFWTSFLAQRPPGAAPEVAPLEQFFTRPLPDGTLYGLTSLNGHGSRWDEFAELQTVDPVKLDRLVHLAPWNRGIVYTAVMAKSDSKPTPQQMLKAMEPFLDYDLQAMNSCAHVLQDQPEAWVRIVRKGAEFYPRNYLYLLDYLRDHKFEAEAAEAYEEAVKHGADPVMISNDSEWVVNYYFDHEKRGLAEKAAAFAAEVYSFTGLETMANLREREERTDEAEDYFGKIAERYQDSGPLIAFYRRHGGEKPASPYAKKLQRLTSAVFPQGIRKARLEDFHDAPRQGVLVAEANAAVIRAGLKLNDVIVALNGDRTDTFEQYGVVRSSDTKPDMRLIVYREGTGYLEITCSQHRRVFGANFVTYEAPRPKAAK